MTRPRSRANGEGTVYQRANGSWVGAAYVPVADGGRRRKEVYGKSRAEVSTKVRRLLTDAENGVVVPTRDWRLGDYLDHWLEHTVKPDRRPKTHQTYELVVRRHIKPVLGRRRLSTLRVADVKQLVDGLVVQGYGTRMVQQVHAVLRNALQTAMREELLMRNVASLVRVKTPTYDVGRGLSVEQSRTLIASTKGERLHGVIVLALYLGLRRAEVLGLRWEDVDVEAGRLEVRQTLQRVEGRLQLLPPQDAPVSSDLPVAGAVRHRAEGASGSAGAGAAGGGGGLDRQRDGVHDDGRDADRPGQLLQDVGADACGAR